MKLLIIRHGRAEEREIFVRTGRPDAERPLVEEGRRRLRASLPGLRAEVERLDAILTSTLTRARQTAEILREAYPDAPLVEIDELAPGVPEERLFERLEREGYWQSAREGCLALVGHEPDLGELASRLLAATPLSFMPLKKGGACLIETSERPHPGCARLLWALTSAQLRRMK